MFKPKTTLEVGDIVKLVKTSNSQIASGWVGVRGQIINIVTTDRHNRDFYLSLLDPVPRYNSEVGTRMWTKRSDMIFICRPNSQDNFWIEELPSGQRIARQRSVHNNASV